MYFAWWGNDAEKHSSGYSTLSSTKLWHYFVVRFDVIALWIFPKSNLLVGNLVPQCKTCIQQRSLTASSREPWQLCLSSMAHWFSACIFLLYMHVHVYTICTNFLWHFVFKTHIAKSGWKNFLCQSFSNLKSILFLAARVLNAQLHIWRVIEKVHSTETFLNVKWHL